MQEYLTTKELAALLRIKERKVYDLAASGKVPCSKAMGKLLFPRGEIEAWIASRQTGAVSPASPVTLPNIMLGSHDPLLEWALRESRSGLATFFDSSVDGLERLAAGEGVAAAVHIYDADAEDWNTPRVLRELSSRPIVVVEWARRQRGLVVAPRHAKRVKGLDRLAGLTFATRQPGAGAQMLFDTLRTRTQPSPEQLNVSVVARSETDVVLAVAEGAADACFGLRSLAEQHRLAFVPVIEERFDLVIDRRSWFEPPLQALMAFCWSDAFQKRAAARTGYDFSNLGKVHFNGP